MRFNTIIPSKPEIVEAELYCSVHLEKNQVDYTDAEEKAKASGFKEQTSRHITVFDRTAREAMQTQMQNMTESERREYLEKIKAILNSFNWEFTQGREVYHIVKEGTFGTGSTVIEYRESYISLINMPDMVLFYKKLSAFLGTKLAPQFPHITLFTKGERLDAPYRGISIPSEEDFQRFCVEKV